MSDKDSPSAEQPDVAQTKADERYSQFRAIAEVFGHQEPATSSPDLLHSQVKAVETFLAQLLEHLDQLYRLSPKVKEFYELWDAENEYRRHLVEDPAGGGKVRGSELVKRTFTATDKEAFHEVSRLRVPRSDLEEQLSRLRLAALKAGYALPSPAEEQAGAERTASGFVHSPDFRSVTVNGESFVLRPTAARIIEYLHEQYERGTPVVSAANIFAELEIEADESRTRLKDYFKDYRGFKALIRKDGSGFRLNPGATLKKK